MVQRDPEVLEYLDRLIPYLESTSEDEWCVDVVRSKDEKQNCLFGHAVNLSGAKDGDNISPIWDWFESAIATTYMVYPVNDGSNSDYPQPTPKQRCIAYMRDIRSGEAETTHECMDRCYAEFKADQFFD